MLILNGSPRRQKTSFRFAQAIQMEAKKQGARAEICHIIDAFQSEKKCSEVLQKMERADWLGLVTPLYVDYLPYPVIWFMEETLNRGLKAKPDAVFFALAQCGFPDARLLDPILGACQIYAKKMDRRWMGGIGYGGGAILDGVPMEDLGKRGESIIEACSMLVEDLLQDREIRDEVQGRMTVKIPKTLFRPLAVYLNHRSRKMARKNGVDDLWAQPYK